MTREELIATLEAAAKPSHDLDEEIMCCAYADLKLERHMEGWYTPDGTHVRVEDYTYSVDAALTLVPDELWRSILHAPNVGKATVSLRTGGLMAPNTKEWMGYAPTPAIALCIAALKARAT